MSRNDVEVVGARRQELKMITKVKKEQQETLELYNSMKLKSDTFRDNF